MVDPPSGITSVWFRRIRTTRESFIRSAPSRLFANEPVSGLYHFFGQFNSVFILIFLGADDNRIAFLAEPYPLWE